MTRPEIVLVTRKFARPGEIKSLLIAESHHWTAERFGVYYQAARAGKGVLGGPVPTVERLLSNLADPILKTFTPEKLEPEDAWYHSNVDEVHIGVVNSGAESGIIMVFVQPTVPEPA